MHGWIVNPASQLVLVFLAPDSDAVTQESAANLQFTAAHEHFDTHHGSTMIPRSRLVSPFES